MVSRVVGVQLKLNKNRHILNHGADRSQQPRNGVEQVLLILRKGDQTDAICSISYQRQQEEEERQTLARLFAVVLDNLGDSRTNSLASTLQLELQPSINLPQIEHGANVAQSKTNQLSSSSRLGSAVSVGTRRLESTSFVGHPPASKANDVNRQQSQCIANPRLRAGINLVVGSLVVGVRVGVRRSLASSMGEQG